MHDNDPDLMILETVVPPCSSLPEFRVTTARSPRCRPPAATLHNRRIDARGVHATNPSRIQSCFCHA